MAPQARPTASRRRRWLSTGVAVLAIGAGTSLGCNTIFGVDELSYGAGSSASGSTSGSGGSTSSSSSSGVGGGPGECAVDEAGCRCFLNDGDCIGLPDLTGWNVGVQRYTGAQADAPVCDTSIVRGSTEPTGVDCPQCGCAPPETSCQVAATFYNHQTCTNSVTLALNFEAPSCTAISNATIWMAAALDFSLSGTCAPSGEPSVEDGAFVALCEQPTSCAEGCIAIPEPDFDRRFCVARDGDHECPPGFDESHKVYGNDTMCSPCACAPATGASCRLLLYFNDAVCDGSHSQKSADATCTGVGSPPPLSGKPEVTNPGSCQASGGQFTTTAPTISQTVCCMSEL
jgi:hypothetical protein